MPDKIKATLRFARLHYLIIAVFLIFLFILFTNTLHVSYPDEFDNIVGGFFIDHGRLPYTGFFTHHGPFAYFYASVLTLFSGASFVKFRYLLAFSFFSAYLLFSVSRFSGQLINTIYLGFFILFVVIQPPFWFLWSILQRNNYHYLLEDKFLTIQKGVISKQNRQLPYASIQDISLTRSLWDRLFGLASLTIQNAAQTGMVYTGRNQAGFLGNSVYIPGLQFDNAQQLRNILLEKVKVNQSEALGV